MKSRSGEGGVFCVPDSTVRSALHAAGLLRAHFSPENVWWGEVKSYEGRSEAVHESLTNDTKGNICKHPSEIHRFTSLSGMALFACLFFFLSFLSFYF